MSQVVEQQARHHRLIRIDRPGSPQEAVLSLMFRKPYEHAADSAEGPILDVGCNTGYGTAILRERTGLEVTGVDVSAAAVEMARERHGGDFHVVDGRTLPFDDGAFGTVTSFQVIEHIEEPVGFLAEIRRVLRPGGRVFLTTPNAAVRVDRGDRPWNRFHVREFRADELRRLLVTHFDAVSVKGLFGSPELERIERARVARLRRIGRLRNRVAGLLPLPVEDALVRTARAAAGAAAGAVGRLRPGTDTVGEMPALSTADLHYSDAELDRALDLIAICQR